MDYRETFFNLIDRYNDLPQDQKDFLLREDLTDKEIKEFMEKNKLDEVFK